MTAIHTLYGLPSPPLQKLARISERCSLGYTLTLPNRQGCVGQPAGKLDVLGVQWFHHTFRIVRGSGVYAIAWTMCTRSCVLCVVLCWQIFK